jgi:3-oxoacyl-[acyl-carrier-protein] synthase II
MAAEAKRYCHPRHASGIGHGFEAQFPAQIALAALIARERKVSTRQRTTPASNQRTLRIGQVLVTLWGHWRGEGMALVSPVS